MSSRNGGPGLPQETMRDRIAIKVMDRLLSDNHYWCDFDDLTPAEMIARDAYLMADAMMREREQ